MTLALHQRAWQMRVGSLRGARSDELPQRQQKHLNFFERPLEIFAFTRKAASNKACSVTVQIEINTN